MIQTFKKWKYFLAWKVYFLQTVDIKKYNVLIDEIKCFDEPVSNNIKTYENTPKISAGQGDGHLTNFLSDYPYFKKQDF